LVRRLAAGPLAAGEHAVPWDGKDDAGRAAASGVYFVRLEGDGVRSTRKAILLR
jgi:flagellar hook assembly protein FlgD